MGTASTATPNTTFSLPPPTVAPALDPLFRPAALATRAFRQRAETSGHGRKVRFALEQQSGSVSQFELAMPPDGGGQQSQANPDPAAVDSFRMLERHIKLALWTHGGFRIHLDAPPPLIEALRARFRETPTGRFDSCIVGESTYGHPIEIVDTQELPATRARTATLGGHLEGCRIGFDLGGSDRKVAAVIDGQVVFSEETEWDPYHQPDPQYHWDGIMDSLRRAAAHLPRVDAIGGSAAGVYVDNQVKFASLFRGVPHDLFERRVKNLFLDLRHAWNDVPFEVANDGDVTALLGSMSLGDGAVLGVALGTSTAGGYVGNDGNITTWLNEIAFAPVDYRPDAPRDEWSGDYGCCVQYLSQQAVGRLIAPAGIKLPPALSLPAQLKEVQALMRAGDPRARNIYQTIGAYLGYAVAHFASVYDFRHVLVLGRVTSGPGGDIMLSTARDVLRADFPDLAHLIGFHVPGEKEKRHGQAIAAASLPTLHH
jgi:predicted NBD/HSP70 family sugar kinase